MAKRRYGKKRGGSRSKKLPLAATIGAVAPIVGIALGDGSATSKMNRVSMAYTGYSFLDGNFEMGRMRMGVLPALAGAVVSMGASKFGLNRYLAKVPFLKI